MAGFLRSAALAVVAGAAVMSALATSVLVAAAPATAAPATAADAVEVHPGMEIRQDASVCTLGFVDTVARIAFSAGHCRGSGTVTDRTGRPIGTVISSRDNTPDGSVVRTDQVISDYQTIRLAAGVRATDILPGGRRLIADPAAALGAGQQVCHFGVVTGESCGTVERINNGWFTMENGVVSQKGDSGGPVYTPVADGTAVIIGLFNSTWGRLPAAVSWQATNQQLREDTGILLTGNTDAAADSVVTAGAL